MVNTNHNTKPTFTKNNTNNRSRSENPPKMRQMNAGHSHHQMALLSPTLENDFASRVNPPQQLSAGHRRSKNQPPPMPEKTKIHLNNKNTNSRERSNLSNPKKSGKSDKRQRRPNQPLPEIPSKSIEPISLPYNGQPFELLPNENNAEMSEEAKAQQYRRSR